eukprot:TRINITY_DN4211_c0_g2_i5.p1 TRINITY_DN4211_c0_g2~~TRINITY_DN4211_c0_g2_i5.p1  ORF type:complete len:101 (-),score=13.96 TRINITY_DN4211_c0_g2_i5:1077-1379(-)
MIIHKVGLQVEPWNPSVMTGRVVGIDVSVIRDDKQKFISIVNVYAPATNPKSEFFEQLNDYFNANETPNDIGNMYSNTVNLDLNKLFATHAPIDSLRSLS